MSTEEPQ